MAVIISIRPVRAGFSFELFSEYAGVPLEQQRSMISCGKKKLEERGFIRIFLWLRGIRLIKNTLKALKECGFSFLTDGFGKAVLSGGGFTFLPVSSRKKRIVSGKQGYTTLVIHANGMNASKSGGMKECLQSIRKNSFLIRNLWKFREKAWICRKSCRISAGERKTDLGKADWAAPWKRREWPVKEPIRVLQVLGRNQPGRGGKPGYGQLPSYGPG